MVLQKNEEFHDILSHEKQEPHRFLTKVDMKTESFDRMLGIQSLPMVGTRQRTIQNLSLL